MRKLFLTGGTGFLGKHIFESWVGDTFLYTRGSDMGSLVRYKPDYIIHAAAEIYENDEMFESNVVLTYKLLEAARQSKTAKAIIIIGSSSEYGLKDHAIKETDYLDPFHIYAGTKGAASLISLSYANKYQLPIMIARPFSLYGKYEPNFRFIPTAIRHMRAGWELPVAPGSHDFIHVQDFVDGLFMMLTNPHPGEAYNFGTGKQYTNMEVVEILKRINKYNIKVKKVPKMREFDTDYWLCDYGKAKKELGWEPRITLEEGLKELCRRS